MPKSCNMHVRNIERLPRRQIGAPRSGSKLLKPKLVTLILEPAARVDKKTGPCTTIPGRLYVLHRNGWGLNLLNKDGFNWTATRKRNFDGAGGRIFVRVTAIRAAGSCDIRPASVQPFHLPWYNDAMKYRKLRIAWSVWCGISCVLLIAFWVRSYWRTDAIWRISPNGEFVVTSAPGTIDMMLNDYTPVQDELGWYYQAHEPVVPYQGLRWELSDGRLAIPIWFFCISMAAISTAPWLRRRFSLRTLLIATTLVAVVLGLIVWAVRVPPKPNFGNSPSTVRVQRLFTITFSK
jgi:hypothetical protein